MASSSNAHNSQSIKDNITYVDVGPDRDPLAVSTNPPAERVNVHEVQGEFSSGLHTQAPPTVAAHSTTQQQVQYDAQGRE